MRFEIRAVTRAMSTLVVLFVLVLGASVEALAYKGGKGRDWGRGHNRGRHLGWERGRRVGHHRRDDDDRSRWRRWVRRNRREERRERRFDRRSSWNNDGNWQRSRFGRDRADFRTRRFTNYRGRY